MSMMQLNRLALVCLISLFLVSCSDEDVDELCEVPLNTVGPDITAIPSYTDDLGNPITTASASDPIKVLVPVDADTRSVILYFASVGGIAVASPPVHFNAGDRIVDRTAETITVDYTAPATGIYYPVMALCSDTVAEVALDKSLCHPSAGYVEDISDVIATSNYARVVVTDPDPTAPILRDPDTNSAGAFNSCVGIRSITIN